MKSYIILALVVSASSVFPWCYGQQKLDLGLKGGLSIPNLSAENSDNPINTGYRSRLGPNAALFVESHFSKHFSLQPQLEYSSQGGKKNGQQAFAVPTTLKPLFSPGQLPPYLYADYKSMAKINYILLSALFKYRGEFGTRYGFYIAAGPFGSIVISAKNITSGSSNIYLDQQKSQVLVSTPQSFENTENIKKDIRSMNTGINAHVGVNYRFANSSELFLEGGFNYGFINIQKDKVNGNNKTGAGCILFGSVSA